MIDAGQDPNVHRNLPPTDGSAGGLDAANRSLADALRASFSVLKGIMAVLVLLYLFSNVRSLGNHEQALILRLGRLLPDVHEADLVWAFPLPIDEIVPLPTRKSNELIVDSHTFHRRDEEVNKPLNFITRGHAEGLLPTLDGALLTADGGLVHVRWKVTYKFDDVSNYVSNIAGDKVEAAQSLLKAQVENIGVQIATELTAEEMIRTRADYVQTEMKRRINERLTSLGAGVEITLVEMFEPTPPIQVRQAFDHTHRAEAAKQLRIRMAEKERTKILNEAAGAAHPKLVALLDEIERQAADHPARLTKRTELNRMLDEDVEGEAGKRIKEAGAYRATVESGIQSDVEQYRTLLPEYRRNPGMLINRLWEQTRQDVLNNPGVTKFYRPPGLRELRLLIPLDPEQAKLEEERRILKKEFDPSKLRREHLVPVGPEAD